MLATQVQAKAILAKHYKDLKVRLTKSATVLVRPNYETLIGLPTLVVRKLASGPTALVWIGQMTPACTIDWDWKEAA